MAPGSLLGDITRIQARCQSEGHPMYRMVGVAPVCECAAAQQWVESQRQHQYLPPPPIQPLSDVWGHMTPAFAPPTMPGWAATTAQPIHLASPSYHPMAPVEYRGGNAPSAPSSAPVPTFSQPVSPHDSIGLGAEPTSSRGQIEAKLPGPPTAAPNNPPGVPPSLAALAQALGKVPVAPERHAELEKFRALRPVSAVQHDDAGLLSLEILIINCLAALDYPVHKLLEASP